MHPKIHSERGIALLQAMIAIGLIMAVTGIFVQINNVYLQEQAQLKQRTGMIELGRRLSTYLTDIAVLQASAVPRLGPGNRMLHTCLGLDQPGIKNGCDPSREYEIVLNPGANHLHPTNKSARRGAAPDRNCPSSEHVSCYLGGSLPDGRWVGYNTEGDAGAWSAEFPLKAAIRFQAVCLDVAGHTEEERRAPCDFAQKIRLSYTLDYSEYAGKVGNPRVPPCDAKTSSCTFPKSREWIERAVFTLTGGRCNEGASATAFDEFGNLLCQCHSPWVPTTQRNPNGVVCRKSQEVCPANYFASGMKDGHLICTPAQPNTLVTWDQKLCMLNWPDLNKEDPCRHNMQAKAVESQNEKTIIKYGCNPATDPPEKCWNENCTVDRNERLSFSVDDNRIADCNMHDGEVVGGWVANMSERCRSYVQMPEREGKSDNKGWLGAAVGGAVFTVGAAVAVGVIAGLWVTTAVVAAIYIIGTIIAALIAFGLALAYFFTMDFDWHIPCTVPRVECVVHVTCAAYKKME